MRLSRTYDRLAQLPVVGLVVFFCSMVLAAGTITAEEDPQQPLRIGIIGLDTSHAIKFTEAINAAKPAAEFAGCRVVAAYPKGSPDIESSVRRVPEYTEKIKTMGVEIVPSIDALLKRVDAVLLETNDGRPHLEQVVPVLKAGKPVFVDKPVAGSLPDVVAIYQASQTLGTPVFSSSSLRYTEGARAITAGAIGDVMGCDAFSPCSLEPNHPDFFWYGIHGVETLFTIMGPGCESVVRVSTGNTDVAVGTWNDGRVGSFRGRRKPGRGYASGYGGTAFGSKAIREIGGFSGYEPLLVEVVKFFRSGRPPVTAEETIEIYTFMEAADESKRRGGVPVKLADVLNRARRAAADRLAALGVQIKERK